MSGIQDTFQFVSVLYLLGAGYTLYLLGQRWRALWDDELTEQDRQLAVMVAIFLLVPIGVLLHELGHIAAAWSTGSQVLRLNFYLYWANVEYIPSNPSPLLEWYVALAGNLVSYLLGIACIAIALFAPRLKVGLRAIAINLGIYELLFTLIMYPLMSLDPGFDGDWDAIYSFREPVAASVTLAVHTASLILLMRFLNSNKKAKWLWQGQNNVEAM